MSTSSKLRVAHYLMAIGLVPILLAAGTTISMAMEDGKILHSSSGGIVIVGMFLMIGGYAGTLLVAGSGLLWSCYLTVRRIAAPTTITQVLRSLVAFVLVAPLVALRSLF
jgi:hypothetical protein